MKIPVEVSARHVHLCQEDLEKLFGKGYQLKPTKKLSQIGEFATEEVVTIVGSKRRIENLRVVGPLREATQVELSFTDCFSLGIDAPLRVSGDISESAGAKLVGPPRLASGEAGPPRLGEAGPPRLGEAGPQGEVDLSEGVIVAKRHLHLNEAEAEELNFKSSDIVKVKVDGERGLIFDNIVVRIKPHFKKSLHLDTDEANAAGLGKVGGFGELIVNN